jgi:hypothetical protein
MLPQASSIKLLVTLLQGKSRSKWKISFSPILERRYNSSTRQSRNLIVGTFVRNANKSKLKSWLPISKNKYSNKNLTGKGINLSTVLIHHIPPHGFHQFYVSGVVSSSNLLPG